MNRTILTGRLTDNPELKGSDKPFTRFRLAVKRKDETDFISCVAFGKTAEFISKYFGKGSMIAIEGRIQTGSYTNKAGQKVYTFDVVVDQAEFCGSKTETKTETKDEKQMGFMDLLDDDGLPFIG